MRPGPAVDGPENVVKSSTRRSSVRRVRPQKCRIAKAANFGRCSRSGRAPTSIGIRTMVVSAPNISKPFPFNATIDCVAGFPAGVSRQQYAPASGKARGSASTQLWNMHDRRNCHPRKILTLLDFERSDFVWRITRLPPRDTGKRRRNERRPLRSLNLRRDRGVHSFARNCPDAPSGDDHDSRPDGRRGR